MTALPGGDPVTATGRGSPAQPPSNIIEVAASTAAKRNTLTAAERRPLTG